MQQSLTIQWSGLMTEQCNATFNDSLVYQEPRLSSLDSQVITHDSQQ